MNDQTKFKVNYFYNELEFHSETQIITVIIDKIKNLLLKTGLTKIC